MPLFESLTYYLYLCETRNVVFLGDDCTENSFDSDKRWLACIIVLFAKLIIEKAAENKLRKLIDMEWSK